ncbi:MAG TPA: hypothetical protein VGG25_14905 [Streptosporangiaceae bacterium]
MSLPDDDGAAASATGRPRPSGLSPAYEDAWAAWAADGEAAVWDRTAADGLEPPETPTG